MGKATGQKIKYNPGPIPPRDPEKLTAWLVDLMRAGAGMGANCGRLCTDCAFKKPLDPTQGDQITPLDVAEQLAWSGRLNCHTPDHKDARKPCAGFEYAKRYLEHLEAQQNGK